MHISRRKIESILILDLEGKLDIPGSALLKKIIREQLEEGSRLFALNFAKVEYIRKETVGTIVSLNKEVTRSEGKFVIFAPHWDVKEYVERFSFDADIPIFDDETRALEALGQKIEERVPGESIYLALGSSSAFKEIFWTVKKLGGVPVERYEEIEQALQGVSQCKVEVVLLDALLPQNGALQAIKELRLDECCRDAVVLVIGPDSARSMYNAMRDYGADDFVPVPFDREELVSSIDKRQFFELLKRKFDLWQEGYYERKRNM